MKDEYWKLVLTGVPWSKRMRISGLELASAGLRLSNADEKTDRLYRDFHDCVTRDDLNVEIHLPKEGQVISKDSNSQAKLMHGIQPVIARNSRSYIENLREEVRKGMREKAAQDILPEPPAFGFDLIFERAKTKKWRTLL